MKFRYLAAMAVALSVSTTAFAANKPEVLFVDGNCNNCHTIGNQTVGPTMIEVADKYRTDKDAQAKLEKKVRMGGSGSWGVMPMPGTRSTISDDDIRILVTWILQQKAEPKSDGKTEQKKN